MRLALLLLVLPVLAFADNLTGTLYEQGTGHSKALFTWTRTERRAGDELYVTLTYLTPEGKEAVVEKVVFDKGRVKLYTIDHVQTGNTGMLEAKDGKLNFAYTKDGKTKTDTEDIPENLVLTATLTDFLASKGEPLLKGDTIEARLGVLDRLETVGFKFFKSSETADTVTIKMKPTSFVIAAIVDPLFLTFHKEGMRIAEINGRTMPKRNVDGKWKDLDVDTVYTWPAGAKPTATREKRPQTR